jgi:N-acetylmuramoyl-L-alanine amidase
MRKKIAGCFFLFCVLQAGAQQSFKTLSLEETLKVLPELQWDSFLRAGTFYYAGHYASFQIGDKGETGFSLIDGYEIIRAPSPYMENGAVFFPEPFVISMKNALDEETKNDLGPFRVAAIIIDPGHGGKDPGAIGKPLVDKKKVTIQEKDVALNVGKTLYEKLVSAYPQKQVLMTRKADVSITLEERVSLANAVKLDKNEAIIYISIHCNALEFKENARGYEIWYLPPNVRRNVIDKNFFDGPEEVRAILNQMREEEFNVESALLAKSILTRFKEFIGNASPSRGIKEEEWYVVKRAHMPSVLVELGFITNPQDAKLLIEPASLKKYTEALYRGISDFITLYEKPGGFSVIE